MNFQGKAILVYLEEDNIARAYFRVQPLMTQEGPLGPVAAEYPDDGFLRIVPDKNEQHTFKERMRSLSGLCLVDLRFFPLDANKIRTNKNYSPARGETNQFIVYSDAVRSLPEDLVYQVVSEDNVKAAATPQVYIRKGANIQGPFRREDGQSVGDTAQLPPDSGEIHEVTLNGQPLLFYWPKAEAAAPEKAEQQPAAPAQPPEPAPEKAPEAPEEPKTAEPERDERKTALEQIQSLNEQVSERVNRLKITESASADFVPEQPPRPLSGTKLYQTPQRQQLPRRAHNSLMEAVENQRYNSRMEVSRYEAPGATIPQNTELKEVHNPADALKRALQGMSHSSEAQRQAVDVVLAQPGVRPLLAKALARETNDLTLAAMHSQLQELEAERLMTLMQLDDAKKGLADAREKAVGALNMAEQKKLDQLHIAQQTAQNALDKLNKAIGPLEEKRKAAAAYLDAAPAMDHQARVICPPVGGAAEKAELVKRVEKCMKAAGFQMEEGDALSMLTAFALSAGEKWRKLRGENPADALYALHAFAAALGTRVYELGLTNRCDVAAGGNTPVFLVSCIQAAVHPTDFLRGTHPLAIATAIEKIGEKEKAEGNWFVPHCDVPVYADPEAIPQALPVYAPVSLECLEKAALSDGGLTEETKAVISSIRKAVAEAGTPLPLASVRMISRFIAATQNELKGGVAEAIDRAFSLFVAAHLLDYGLEADAVKPQLTAMPRTLKALKA